MKLVDENPNHPNTFQYEELLNIFIKIASQYKQALTEKNFVYPYVLLKKDSPNIWILQGQPYIDVTNYANPHPPTVKKEIPAIKISDEFWPCFQDKKSRERIVGTLERLLPNKDQMAIDFSSFAQEEENEILEDNLQKTTEHNELEEILDATSIISNSNSEQEFDTQKSNLEIRELEKTKNYPLNPKYSLFQINEETNIEIDELKRWIEVIKRKKQAIFYGPPGTGKTFIAKKIAEHLIGEGDGFSDIVQFHPAYTYEDFIQGIRPKIQENNLVQFKNEPGCFMKFCSKAQNHGRCVLIIDEINRANLSLVFGELMYLLEYRSKSKNSKVKLAGGDELDIPENVIIIGTMNTADRSIALVDYALRRRFAFIKLEPQYDVLKRFHENNETGFPVGKLCSFLESEVNKAIRDTNLMIGISFFMHQNLHELIEDIWRYEIQPYLEECLFANPQDLAKFDWEKVRKYLEL
jgi:DNA polymerase III delta prime subunit